MQLSSHKAHRKAPMKKAALFLFVFFLIPSTLPKKTCYSLIQPLNLSSLEWQEEDWPNEPYRDYILRCFRYQLHPQEAKRRRIVFRLFDRLAEHEEQPHSALSDLTTAQDLNLFNGPKVGDPYLAELVDRTKTELGKVFFYGMLAHPTHDISMLESRQQVIKHIVYNPELHSQLTELYTQIATTENMLLSFWAQDGFVQATKRQYFSFPYFTGINEKLNSSQTALAVSSFWQHQQRVLFLATGALTAVLLPAYALAQIRNKPLPDPFDEMAKRLQGSGGASGRLLALISSFDSKGFTAGVTLVAGGYAALACKKDFLWVTDNVTLDICLQKKMTFIAHLFRTVIELDTLLAKSPQLLNLLPAAKKIHDFFTQTMPQDAQLTKLLTMAEDGMQQGESSFFEYQGRTLAAFHLMYNCKAKLEPLLLALGELEAYLSIATLYTEHKDTRVQFCFARYSTTEEPVIRLERFWNPFISEDKVVTNNLFLQGPEQRNMIITGPNAGGKSTLIKALALNLFLAQSICLAAADSLEFTPFYTIGTYLNVVDDIASGNSLFKAQVLRAQKMVELVEKTPLPYKCFIALDEMFNGTSAKESEVTAYSVADHIGQYKNTLCALATHFPLLTTLAKENNAFANYKVTVDIDEARKIHYPFTLEKGISDQHVALDIVRQEGYSYSIIDKALNLLDREK